MKRSSAILKSLVVLGILTFGLAASASVIISRPGLRPFPPRPPIILTPGTNRPPIIIITNLPPIFITNRPPIRITNLPPILPPTQIFHCTPAPADLVGWWKGEGNGNDSVGNNNATLPAGVTYAFAEVGQGFNLDGQNHLIVVPDAPALNFGSNQDFSIEAWIMPLAAPSNIPADEMTIVDKRYAPNAYNYHGYHLYLVQGQLYFQMADTSTSIGGLIVQGGPDLRDGKFHHVAVTVARSSATGGELYVDGQPVLNFDPTAFSGSLSNSDFLRIGNHPTPGYVTPFHGMIDELSLYGRRLSSNEIASIYSAGSAGKCPIATPTCVSPPAGLVGWWPAESNANDVVGGNNGTLEGGATFAPGMAGQGFRLDGTNSYVQIPDAAALKPANVTVEAWVWLDPDITTPRLEYIIFKRNSWTYLFEGYSLLKESLPNGDGTYTDRFSFVVTSGGDQVITYSTTAVQRGVWYHVAGTYDGNELTLWVNGAAEASAIAGFALDYGTRPVFIGTSGEPEPYNGKLAGIIDEASIYDRALSSNEIASIFSAGSAGKCTPACTPAPSGLVSWWPAEENANDIVGTNNGTPQNITSTAGEVGQAFVFDGSSSLIMVPASSSLDVGLGSGFTIETWVNPAGATLNNLQSLMEWNVGSGSGEETIGAQFGFSGGWNADLYANIMDTTLTGHYLNSAGGIMTGDSFQHVALTFDKTTGLAVLYRNGVVVQSANLGTGFTPWTSNNFYIGCRPAGPFANYFHGIIDEPSLYNRALSPDEIAAIYNAGSAGKCAGPLPPGITVHPVNQTTVQGSNVVLSVDVVGTGPFSYQWSFNGTNISGATNATLTLTNLHPYQSGCYAVTITTPYGSITSSCATVTVIARNILVYKYFGTGRFTTAGQAFTYVYSGQMFFIPDSTNGTFVGWGTIKGNKQYWVNPLSDYLLITIPGASNQTFTVLGQAGQEIDTNGYPHIWSYLHKGKNTPLTIGKNKYFSFPNTFTADATHVYPDSQTGNMVLSESSSIYTFVPQSTQTANNTGQTMTDLVNALTNSLDSQGYQKQ